MTRLCFLLLALCIGWMPAYADDPPAMGMNSNGSYDVTKGMPPDPACPSIQTEGIEHHLANRLIQTITTRNAQCGQSSIVQVLGPDGAVMAEEDFAGADTGVDARLVSMEFINKGGNWQTEDIRFSPDKTPREIVVAGTPAQHNTVVCIRSDKLLLWKVSQYGVKGSTNVQDLHKVLPPNLPVTYDEAQQVWTRLLNNTASASAPVQAGQALPVPH